MLGLHETGAKQQGSSELACRTVLGTDEHKDQFRSEGRGIEPPDLDGRRGFVAIFHPPCLYPHLEVFTTTLEVHLGAHGSGAPPGAHGCSPWERAVNGDGVIPTLQMGWWRLTKVSGPTKGTSTFLGTLVDS